MLLQSDLETFQSLCDLSAAGLAEDADELSSGGVDHANDLRLHALEGREGAQMLNVGDGELLSLFSNAASEDESVSGHGGSLFGTWSRLLARSVFKRLVELLGVLLEDAQELSERWGVQMWAGDDSQGTFRVLLVEEVRGQVRERGEDGRDEVGSKEGQREVDGHLVWTLGGPLLLEHGFEIGPEGVDFLDGEAVDAEEKEELRRAEQRLVFCKLGSFGRRIAAGLGA